MNIFLEVIDVSIFARLFRDNRPAGYRNSETPDTFSDDDNNFRHGIHHHDDDDDDDFDDDNDSGDDGGGD